MAFNLIPYTNFHDLNLDWILGRVKAMDEAKDDILASIDTAHDAITAAEAAKTGAEAAQDGAEAAQLAAEAAQGYAEAAATNAGNSASTAQDIVNTALDNIGDATSGAVADWLAENVSPSTGYVVDKTLSIEGAAADSKAVGVAVSGLRNFWKENYVDLTWNNYRITADGNITASTDYLLTDPIPVHGGIAVTIPDFNEDVPGFNPFYLYVALYSDENTFVSLSAAQSEGFAILADEGYYFRMMARYQTTATLAPANAPFTQITVLSPTDTDIRAVPYAGEAGKAADARATSQALLELSIDKASASDLNSLSSALNDVENTIGYENIVNVDTANLINKDTAQDGYIIDAATGEPIERAGYSLTGFERCNPNSVYSVWWGAIGLNSSMIATYDNNYNFIGIKTANSGTNYKVTESNAYYVRVAYATSTADTIMCVEGQTYPGQYSAYSNVINESNQSDVIVKKHIYVSTTGNDSTGDGTALNPYATIYHANETITDAGKMKRYIIHVADGIYTDLQTRYSGIAGSNYQGVICKDYVSYIGNVENPAACILQWDGATGFSEVTESDISWKGIFHILQTLDTKSLHTEIAGFTIDATNTRYCQHIEMSGYGYGVEWYIHDCVFAWHGQPALNNPSYSPACIGTGCGLFESGRIERCIINADTGLVNGYVNHDSPIRYFSYSTVKAGTDITIKDCVFNAGNAGRTNIWCRSTTTNEGADTYDLIHVINCHGVNELKYTTSGGATINWRADVIASDITTNQFDTP